MFPQWNRLSLLERALALRIGSLAHESLTADPGRSLTACVLEAVQQIPEILEEHLPWLRADWAERGEEGVAHWCEAGLLAVEEIASASEVELERDAHGQDVLSRTGTGTL